MTLAAIRILQLLNNIYESEKDFWDKIYADGKQHWTEKDPSNLTKKIISKYKKLGNVLEIGCAAGIDTVLLATVADSVIGIDIVKAAVDLAKENLKNSDKSIQSKVTYEEGDAENLKYKDGQFDFVYSLSVLHSTDVTKSLKEVKRVLNDTGKAVIYVYTGDGSEEIDKDDFIKTCKEYFTIVDQSEVELTDKSNDKHNALIIWLEVKNE